MSGKTTVRGTIWPRKAMRGGEGTRHEVIHTERMARGGECEGASREGEEGEEGARGM